MLDSWKTTGEALVASALGERTQVVLATIDLDGALAHSAGHGKVSRIAFAAALNALLFDGLLARVPTGANFVADQLSRGERIRFDHGALRTILFPDRATGGLPGGQEAFARILRPLGYEVAGTYPLPRLRMTGRAWVHREVPEKLPQFFVSELHIDQFDLLFQATAHRVFGSSGDPLNAAATAVLDQFAQHDSAPLDSAVAALPVVAAAFGCHHQRASFADYELLLNKSAEAGWIATEGNAFNHATSLVDNVEQEAVRQRERGLAIKDSVEISQTGRVRQTAFLADPVIRQFEQNGLIVERSVPGSFYEIISRDIDPATGVLDLSFDSGNATGIFGMTRTL